MGKLIFFPPRIRIIRLPPAAKIPAEIIRQFIGLEFPISEIALCSGNHPYGRLENGYMVSKKLAMRILKRKLPKVHDWFLSNQHILEKPYLFFPAQTCAVVGFLNFKRK